MAIHTSVPPVTGSIPSRGSLQKYPLDKLLHSLYMKEKTGMLCLACGKLYKIIYIQSGFPVWAESTLESESLGSYLVNNRKITMETYSEVQKKAQETGKKHDAVLLETGALTPHELYEALINHLQVKILSCFTWTTGEFEFKPLEVFPGGIEPIKLEPARLIMDGRKKKADLSGARSIPPVPDYLLAVPSDRPPYTMAQMQMTPEEQHMYNLLMSGKTLGEIPGHVSSRHDLVEFMLLLEELGVVRLKSKRKRTSRKPAQRKRKKSSRRIPVSDTQQGHDEGIPAEEAQASQDESYEETGQETPREFPDADASEDVPDEAPQQMSKAESEFRRGIFFLEDRKFEQAAAMFDRAVSEDANEARYHAYLGWSLYLMNPESRLDDAHEYVQMALTLDPGSKDAAVFRECLDVARETGSITGCLKRFIEKRNSSYAQIELRYRESRMKKKRDSVPAKVSRWFKRS